MRYETFAPLTGYPHAFTLRDPGDETRAADFPVQVTKDFGYSDFAAAEQTHGNGVAIVNQSGTVAGVDALITRQCGLPLIIRCADCAPVFIIDRAAPVIALVHPGKKGTNLNVVGATVAAMQPRAGVAFIGPSIGACHYEMDLWTEIEAQLRAAGITEIHNSRICTACHLDRYYSYRAERGQTRRMCALLALA